jgi:hypothetical protein
MAAKDISPETLRSLLHYDPGTGVLTWKRRPRELFPTEKAWAIWNGRYAGKRAFTSQNHNGYFRGAVFNNTSLAHRVAWALVHGVWPDRLDHVNGDPSDNRLANLRVVSHRENLKNTARRADNTSGTTGVSWFRATQKWSSCVHLSGKKIHLGYFDNKEDAIAARMAANERFGFHPNHGREART